MLVLRYLKRHAEAEAALRTALELEPDSMDYLYALADHYIKRGQLEKAEHIDRQMVAKHPDRPFGHQLLKFLLRHLHDE